MSDRFGLERFVPRLVECARIVGDLEVKSAQDVFGAIDAMKLRSSMTLFVRADPDNAVFRGVIEKYFGGELDDATDRLLRTEG